MPDPAHRIRLREPWTADGLLLYRRFGKPSNLHAGQTVWLVLPDVAVQRVAINETELPAGVREWDVTAVLDERNQVEVTLTAEDQRAALTAGAALEIRG